MIVRETRLCDLCFCCTVRRYRLRNLSHRFKEAGQEAWCDHYRYFGFFSYPVTHSFEVARYDARPRKFTSLPTDSCGYDN